MIHIQNQFLTATLFICYLSGFHDLFFLLLWFLLSLFSNVIYLTQSKKANVSEFMRSVFLSSPTSGIQAYTKMIQIIEEICRWGKLDAKSLSSFSLWFSRKGLNEWELGLPMPCMTCCQGNRMCRQPWPLQGLLPG